MFRKRIPQKRIYLEPEEKDDLKKLDIKPPSRNTVKKIIKNAGHNPAPGTGDGSWGGVSEDPCEGLVSMRPMLLLQLVADTAKQLVVAFVALDVVLVAIVGDRAQIDKCGDEVA